MPARPATRDDFRSPDLSDESLAALTRLGSSGAVESLLERYAKLPRYVLKAYFPFVLRRSAQSAECEAAIQVAVWKAALSWCPARGRAFRPYAVQGARQAAFNVLSPHRKSHGQELRSPQKMDRYDASVGGDESLDALADALNLLPAPEREVLTLRYGVGRPVHTVPEAGLSMGLSDAEVERLAAGAIGRVRRYIRREPAAA